MPGNVNPISGAMDTFPFTRYGQYAVSLSRHCLISEYPDGSSQRASDVSTSLRAWRFTLRVTPAQMSTLKAFYWSHVAKPFAFTDFQTGTLIKAVITTPWSEVYSLSRAEASLEVQEAY